jgi:signal transduction histidine kinase
MPKYHFLFWLSSFLLLSEIKAQSPVDSLIRLLPKTQNDTAVARLYKSIADQLQNEPKRAIHYANEGLKWVEKMNWPKGIAIFKGMLGRLYTDEGDYERAMPLILSEIQIHRTNEDTFNLSSATNALGTLHLRQGQYSPALQAFFAALKLAEQAKIETLQPLLLENIAIVYSEQQYFDKSFAYTRRALQRYRRLDDQYGMAACHASLANKYQLLADTAKAIESYQRALFLLKKVDAPLKLAEVYQNQALLFKKIHQRLDRQLKAQEIWDESFPGHQLSITNLSNIAWTFLDSAKQNSKTAAQAALKLANQSYQKAFELANQSRDRGNLHLLLGLKAELAAAQAQYEQAYRAMYQFHAQHDSIYSQASKNKLAEAESNYFLEKKNAEIAIQELTIIQQRRVQWAFVLSSLLLLLIVFLLYRASQMRRKSNEKLQVLNQSLDQANRQKAQLLAVISHDLRHPLSNLINLLTLQKNDPDLLSPELALKSQEKITQNTEVLLENLENMLLWSKEQMSQASVQVEAVPVAALFQRLRATYVDQAEIAWTFQSTGNLMLKTDPNYLWIILQNLSSNAQKALKSQADGQIDWRAWPEDSHVHLEIRDNGPGFSPELLEQLNAQTGPDLLLSGFGLQVVRDFAQKLGLELQFGNLESGGAWVRMVRVT